MRAFTQFSCQGLTLHTPGKEQNYCGGSEGWAYATSAAKTVCPCLSTCAKETDLAQDRTRPRRECSECGRASVVWVAFPHWETLRHSLSVAAGAKEYQDVRLFVYLGRQGVCVCVCIVHVPTHMYMCICVHMSAYVCVCTCVSVCVHVCGCGTGEGGLG